MPLVPLAPLDADFYAEMLVRADPSGFGRIADAARATLYELAARSSYLAYLARRDGDTVSVIETIDGAHLKLTASLIREPAPLHTMAAGKVMLAYSSGAPDNATLGPLIARTKHTVTSVEQLARELETIRMDGYCVIRGEYSERYGAIAAPIFQEHIQAVAAIGLVGPVDRFGRENVQWLAPMMISAAMEVSRDLGWRGWLN